MNSKKTFLLAILTFVLIGSAWAQGAEAPTFKLVPLENKTAKGAGGSFKLALETTIRDNFQTIGFRTLPPLTKENPDFLIQGYYVVEGENLIFQISVEYLALKRLVAGDMASFFSGLTALDLINEMTAGVAKTSFNFYKKLQSAPKTAIPLPEPLVFTGPEGTLVSWAGGERIGEVVSGSLEVPYYPFPSDGHLSIKVEKKGFQPRLMKIELTQESRDIPLAELTPLVEQELVFTTGLGRILGLGLSYHHYIDPNNLFLSAEVHLYGQYALTPGSAIQSHLDLWSGIGYYLFSPPEADLRFFYEFQLGLLASPLFLTSGFKTALDLAISPLGLGLEYRGIRDWPLVLGVKLPYSFGIPGGLLPRSWLMIAGNIPSISLGVIKRW